jgi:hypothetical protein
VLKLRIASKSVFKLNAVRESLHVDHAMTAGAGAIVWIKSGRVVDCVINAADAGVDQLIARTRKAFPAH